MNIKSEHIKIPNTNVIDFERINKEETSYRARISESPNKVLEVKFIDYQVIIENTTVVNGVNVTNNTVIELKDVIEIGKLGKYILDELEE